MNLTVAIGVLIFGHRTWKGFVALLNLWSVTAVASVLLSCRNERFGKKYTLADDISRSGVDYCLTSD
jgi:hypothetical protein